MCDNTVKTVIGGANCFIQNGPQDIVTEIQRTTEAQFNRGDGRDGIGRRIGLVDRPGCPW